MIGVPEPADEYPSIVPVTVPERFPSDAIVDAIVDALAYGTAHDAVAVPSEWPARVVTPAPFPTSLEAAVLSVVDQAETLAILSNPHRLPDDATPAFKETNPKDLVANDHVKFSALPLRVLAGVAVAMTEGAYKYRRHNYRVAGVKASVYFDATLDHLLGWFEGEDIDPDSGRHHIDKALASLFVLRDAMLGGKCHDDRPPAVREPWIKDAHAATKELFARMRDAGHGDHKPPYTITDTATK